MPDTLALCFEEHVKRFSDFGQPSLDICEGSIRYLINEFWTAGQRQAHALHEVSYRACFKPQLPEFFIRRLTKPGDAVYDPFMGRGTTPVQAALMGRRPVGNDVNPLSVLLCRPRLNPPVLREVAHRLGQITWDAGAPDDPDLLAFYSPQTLRHIAALRRWLMKRAPLTGNPDPVDDWIRMVAINRLTGHSPGFFSVYTLPPNQAVSAESQRKINAKRGQTPPDRDVKTLILKKTAALLADGPIPPHPPALLTTGAAQSTPAIGDGTINTFILLIYHATGTDIDVPDFAVAHLPARKPYRGTRRIDEAMGMTLPPAIPVRRTCLGNGVILGIFAISPAIEDQE